MGASTPLELSIKIAGQVDSSLYKAFGTVNKQIGGMEAALTTISRVGRAGLAAIGAAGVGAALALNNCTNEAQAFEQQMADVVKYVDGLANSAGKITSGIWKEEAGGNGQTFAENYGEMKKALLDLSTQIPMTAEELTQLAASAGQSGKSMNELFSYDANGNISGFLQDVAMTAYAMDISAEQAGDWAAKWEKSLSMSHEQVMVLFDQINYLGAHSATTAAEIASVVNEAASLAEFAGMDAASTAALADAMLAMGVESSVASTSITRMLVNMNKGTSATKAQQEAWAELGLTAQGVAAAMQNDAAGTIVDVLGRINDASAERQTALLSTLFGQWAIKGAAKLTGNIDTFISALNMVRDPGQYDGSMNREFVIKATTSQALDERMQNAFRAFKISVGDDLLPAKQQVALAVIDLMNTLRNNMPQISVITERISTAISKGVTSAATAIENALPRLQSVFDFLLSNGEMVVSVFKGVVLTLAGMSMAKPIASMAGGVGSLVTGGVNLLAGTAQPGGTQRTGGLLSGLAAIYRNGQAFGGKIAAMPGAIAAVPGNAMGWARAFADTTRGTMADNYIPDGKWNFFKTAASALTYGTPLEGPVRYISSVSRAATKNKIDWAGMGTALSQTKIGGAIVDLVGKNGLNVGDPMTLPGRVLQFAGGQLANGANSFATSKTGGALIGAVQGIFGQKGLNIGNPLTLPMRIAQFAGGQLGGTLTGIRQSAAGQAGLSVLSGIGGIAGNLFGGMATAVSPIVTGFASLFTGIAPIIAGISTVIALFSILGGRLDDIRGLVENTFGEKGVKVFDTFRDKLGQVGNFVASLFQNRGLSAALEPVANMIQQNFGNGAAAGFNAFVGVLQSVLGVIGQIVSFANNRVKPIIESIFNYITVTVAPILLQTFTAMAPYISQVIDGLGSAIMTGMNIIGQAINLILPYVQGFITLLLQVGSVVVPALMAGLGTIASGIATVMEGIQNVFNGIVEFINNVFAGNWAAAWGNIQQIFGDAWNALVDLAKIPLNAVISAVNNVFDKIGGVKIPEWAQEYFGMPEIIGLPHFDLLARGGLTNGPSIAGEAGQEAVISFMPSERGRNIDLWKLAGQRLGVYNEMRELPETAMQAGTGQSMSVSYSPNITIQGSASRQDVETALQQGFEQFCQFMDRYNRAKVRTAY